MIVSAIASSLTCQFVPLKIATVSESPSIVACPCSFVNSSAGRSICAYWPVSSDFHVCTKGQAASHIGCRQAEAFRLSRHQVANAGSLAIVCLFHHLRQIVLIDDRL